MRMAWNMAAAMANSVSLVLINLIALPFYLRYLGMEAYGLIGFYVTLQTVLQVLDVGLAPTVSREIARDAEIGRKRRSASLLRTLGVVYIGVAIAVAVLVALAAPWISTHWLQAKSLPDATIAQAVAMMGLNIACRWPISLYHGALVGAHRLARSSTTSMAINIATAATTIAVLEWGDRSIQAFFLVQAAFGLLHGVVLRMLARRAVGECDAPYDFGDLPRVMHFSVWMSGTAIISIVFMQLEKALLSRYVDLEAFGHYMLAALLVSGLSVLTGPAFNVIYPKFTTLFARGDDAGLTKFYSETSRIYAAILFSLAFVLILHAEAIVTLWTGNPGVARYVAPLAALLATGSALNGVMYFPYALQLSSGQPKVPFAINAALLVVVAPGILWLVMQHGTMGGALSWALIGVVYLLVGTIATGRKVAGFAGAGWLLRDIAVPFMAAFAIALAGAWISLALDLAPLAETAIALFAACGGIVSGCLYSPLARQHVLGFISGGRRSCPN